MKLIESVVLFISFLTVTGNKDKIRLENVKAITLYKGRMTNARRSSPIQQLTCVGGRAGCLAFEPTTVQCYNRGFDGSDVQWECKTEMDNRYKFGQIEVSCEGYDYPDDPYILKGSCGLEYTIDHAGGGGGWSSDSWFKDSSHHGSNKRSGSGLSNLIMIGIIALVIYAIYRSFRSPLNQNQFTNTNDDYPDDGYRGYPGANQPPPPGFRPEFMPGDPGGCGAGRRQAGGGYGGFWTGAAAGGLLGYLMGNNNRGGVYERPYARNHGTGGFFGGGGGGGFGGGGGTRETSGFGGTRRR